MLKWKLDTREATSKLDRVVSGLKRPRALFASWGLSVRDWCRQSARSRKGRFWGAIAAHTNLKELSDSGVTVECAASGDEQFIQYAAVHKEYGGVIRPKNKKCLTIPISPEAKGWGKTAGRFALGGKVLFVPKGTNLLGYSSGKGGKFKALFVLVKSVNQKAYPWWIRREQALAIGEREGIWWLRKQTEA